MDHSHGAADRSANRKRLSIVLMLSAAYMVAEVVGGLLTNSLALIADAGHMLSDVAALALSLFAMWIAQRPPTPRQSYGYYRSEILAALVNGATLIAIAVYVFIEAYDRFRWPPEVQGGLMMAIASGGLAINLIGLWVLSAGRNESLNVRGAWLHVATDALGSIGVIVGGLLIWTFGWHWADPSVSVLIGILVIYSSWKLLKQTVTVLMEGAPGHIDVDAVRDALAGVPGVTAVHDLHIWSITSGMVALSGHVCVSDGAPNDVILGEIRKRLRDGFAVDHITVQIEPEGFTESVVHA
jgi:cobalt-zinc-cadmium efflux system protein